jgi:hypothetical protein
MRTPNGTAVFSPRESDKIHGVEPIYCFQSDACPGVIFGATQIEVSARGETKNSVGTVNHGVLQTRKPTRRMLTVEVTEEFARVNLSSGMAQEKIAARKIIGLPHDYILAGGTGIYVPKSAILPAPGG